MVNRHNLEKVQYARRRVAALAQDVLDGRLSILLAAQELSRLQRDADVPDDDEDFVAFVAIDSETDHLPVAPRVRPLWDPAALKVKDEAIARAETWARDFGLEACRNLVSRFGTA